MYLVDVFQPHLCYLKIILTKNLIRTNYVPQEFKSKKKIIIRCTIKSVTLITINNRVTRVRNSNETVNYRNNKLAPRINATNSFSATSEVLQFAVSNEPHICNCQLISFDKIYESKNKNFIDNIPFSPTEYCNETKCYNFLTNLY